MSRRKGELTSAAIDRDWPHQVALQAAITIERFHEIQAFVEPLSRAPYGHSVVHDGCHYNVYCFADEKDAEVFRAKYGGTPFYPKDRGRGVAWWRWNRR